MKIKFTKLTEAIKPLSSKEKELYPIVKEYFTDLYERGDLFPEDLERIHEKGDRITPDEYRQLLQYFMQNAPSIYRNAGGKPLTPEEQKELAQAVVYFMDMDADGDTLPPDLEKILNKGKKATPNEDRKLLKYFYQNTPGYIS